MKCHLAIAVIALLCFTATKAHAACSRDDISFYLSEGFTQEQITAICSAATDASAPPTDDGPEPTENMAVVPPADGNDKDMEDYLREVIKGQDVRIEEGFLHYTAKICIPYGKFSNNKEPWNKETCELVRHKVTLQGMKAKRELFSLSLSRPRQIYLEGQIEREFVGDLSDYGASKRRQIIQNLHREVKAIVPIKENMSTDRLLESLNKIAASYGELDG